MYKGRDNFGNQGSDVSVILKEGYMLTFMINVKVKHSPLRPLE